MFFLNKMLKGSFVISLHYITICKIYVDGRIFKKL